MRIKPLLSFVFVVFTSFHIFFEDTQNMSWTLLIRILFFLIAIDALPMRLCFCCELLMKQVASWAKVLCVCIRGCCTIKQSKRN